MRRVIIIIGLLSICNLTIAQNYKSVNINDIEAQILNLVNKHRIDNGLSELEISQALCYVADEHVRDLYDNKTYEKTNSLHSWSRKSGYKPINFYKGKNAIKKIKAKPKEVVNYVGDCLEIAYYNDGIVNAENIVSFWKMQHQTNSLMLNSQPYAYPEWEVMGIAEYNGFVCLWFGPTTDNASIIKIEKDYGRSKSSEVASNIKTTNNQASNNQEKAKEQIKEPPTVIYDFDKVDGRPERFYLIVFSSTDESNCRDFFKSLLDKGNDDAEILKVDGKIRVSLKCFSTREEADKYKNEIIRTTEFKDAWILRR